MREPVFSTCRRGGSPPATFICSFRPAGGLEVSFLASAPMVSGGFHLSQALDLEVKRVVFSLGTVANLDDSCAEVTGQIGRSPLRVIEAQEQTLRLPGVAA